MESSFETRYCLVTISDEDFSIATEVLLYSFLKYNSWFAGEVIVIADDLPVTHRQRLERLYPVRFIAPDPRLRYKIDILREHVPDLDAIYRRFFSFEVFRLSHYGRAVYLDSDMYCAGDILELFERPEPLLACPDGFTYSDRILALLAERRGEQTRPVTRYGRTFSESFNAGVISIGGAVLGDQTYRDLLNMLDVDTWTSLGQSIFTDQMILNIHFENRFTPIPGKYNYMVFLEQYQKCLEAVSFLDAKLVHFAGAIKPWYCYDAGELVHWAPHYIKFIDVWRELLEETRHCDDPHIIDRRYARQKEWIKHYKTHKLSATGRLY
ncbi:MAG: glycosyltransferase [Gammaproteobacteria bacterium]|jgi:lipopolysaccharide biosynthesis glycosyltransferase